MGEKNKKKGGIPPPMRYDVIPTAPSGAEAVECITKTASISRHEHPEKKIMEFYGGEPPGNCIIFYVSYDT